MKLVVPDQQWRAGVVYARWVPELAFGLGYPTFNLKAHFDAMARLLGYDLLRPAEGWIRECSLNCIAIR
jgi:hypothetical protein